jgi:HlyD family secretion protein
MRAQLSVAVVSLLVVSCFSGYSEGAPQSPLRVRRGSLTRELVLTGELDAARGAAITVPSLPQWQSSIKWIANDGIKVAKGERVVELDNSTFTADLDSKRQTELQVRQEIQQKQSEWEADFEQKQLDFDTKKSELDKAKIDASVPKEILSFREYQDRQIKVERASVEYAKALDILKSQKKEVEADRRNLQLRLQKAQREIRLAESAIESVVLRAPRDGMVIIRDHPWEGRKVQLGDTVWVGFPLALIPEMSSLRVSAALADVDDGRIAVGMPVSVVLDGYPEQTFNGKVTNISAVAQESNRQSLRRAFKVFVNLDRVDAQRMRPGLSARLVVRTQTIPNVLIAPRTALDLSSAKPRARLAGGRSVDVKLGGCNAQECVVSSGLEEGQRLARADGDVNG